MGSARWLTHGHTYACLIAIAAVAAAGCGSPASARGERQGSAAAEAREVRVVPAAEERLVRTIRLTGTLAAEEQVTLSMKVTGRLDVLTVDLGSRVSRGQVIARLIPTDFRLRASASDAALQQARARLGLPPQGEDDRINPEATAIVRSAKAVLDEARLTKDRIETFVKRGISARADLDAAEASLQVADSKYQDAMEEVRNRQAVLEQRRTELELARQALRDSSLTAPLDGVVRERQTSVGQYLAAGSPVVTIVRVDPLRLRLAIPERESQSIRTNQEVRVSVEGDPTVHPGRVARISPAIEEASRTLTVEAEVPNHDGALRPGAFATAEIITAAGEQAVLVPSSSLVTFAGVDKVLIVKDGRIVERRVTTGRHEGERVEIVRGLSAGEPVVAQPGNLVEGASVHVADAPRPAAR
jgi:multidrug efflux pump subunit AcrA (membrane-fusion protein)